MHCISSLAQQQSSSMFDPDPEKPYAPTFYGQDPYLSQAGHYPYGCYDASIADDDDDDDYDDDNDDHYRMMSPMQQGTGHHPSFLYFSPSNSTLLSSTQNVTDSYSSTLPQTDNCRTGAVPVIDTYLALSLYPSNDVIARQHFLDGMRDVYNSEGQAVHHHPCRYFDTSIADDRHRQFSPIQQGPEHHPSLSCSCPPNSTLLSSTQNVTDSYSSTLPQTDNCRTGAVPQIDQSIPQMYIPGGNAIPVKHHHYRQRTQQLPQSAPSDSHRAKPPNGTFVDTTWLHAVVIHDNKFRSSPSASPKALHSRMSSSNRRKRQAFGWPQTERPQYMAPDAPATGSGSLRAIESSTHHHHHHRHHHHHHHHTTPPPVSYRSSRKRVATAARWQHATESESESSSPTGSTQQSLVKFPMSKKSNADRMLTIACLFCRERKIACKRPPEGSPDDTCNQCARRQFKCEYPKDRRRGRHKRNKKSRDVNNAK